jgi:hypothetical protein
MPRLRGVSEVARLGVPNEVLGDVGDPVLLADNGLAAAQLDEEMAGTA